MEWGTPVEWGWFLLFSRSGGRKTKETYPLDRGPPLHVNRVLNASSLPPQFCITIVSPGYYSRPKRNRRQWLCKILVTNKVHYGLCENSELYHLCLLLNNAS